MLKDNKLSRLKPFIGVFLALAVLIIQISLISRVGFTWDEPTIYFFGKRTFDFWKSFPKAAYPDYSPERKLSDGPFHYVYNAIHYPPFIPLLGAVSDQIFRERLQLTTIVVSYHIPLIIIGSLGVLAMYGLLRLAKFTRVFSSIGALLFITYPTIWGQMRNDAKDVPVAMGLTGAVFAWFYLIQSLEKKHPKELCIATILFGVMIALALVMKPTAVIIIPILFIWGCLSLLYKKNRLLWIHSIRLFSMMMIAAGAIGFLIVLFSWPYLWQDAITKLQAAFAFFKTVGFDMPVEYFGKVYFAGKNVPWHYPFGILAVQTPPFLLLLAGIGAVYSVWLSVKQKNSIHVFFLLWFVLGISRFLVPGVIIYAKVRHFLDVMPAFLILSMYGLLAVDYVRTRVKLHQLIVVAMGIGLVLYHLIISVQYFPYEPSYFNIFAGAGKGVATNKLFDIEYWGSSTREAMEIIAKRETKPALVYACGMGHLAKYYATSTVKVTGDHTRADYIIIPNSPSYFWWVLEAIQPSHELFYTIRRAGADLAWIYKRTGTEILPQCGPESEEIMN